MPAHEKMKLFLKGQQVRVRQRAPIEIRPYPRAENGRGRTKDSEYSCSCARSRRPPHLRRVEKQFRGYYEEANKKTGKTGEVLLQILESAWTTWSTAQASRSPATCPPAGAPRPHQGERPQGRHPVLRVSANDIVEVAASPPRWCPSRSPRPRPAPGRCPPGSRSSPASSRCSSTRSRPAGHRHAGPGADDRRALLEVSAPRRGGRTEARPVGTSPHGVIWRVAGGHEGDHMLIAQRPTLTEETIDAPSGRGSSSSRWAGLRLHPRQLPAPHPPVLDPVPLSPASASRAPCTSSPPCRGSRRT